MKIFAITRIIYVSLLQRFRFGSTSWYTRKIAVGMEGNELTIEFLKRNYPKEKVFLYAEFGAFHGGTALQVLEYFPNCKVFVFDYSYSVEIMRKNLIKHTSRVRFFENSQKFLDSYNCTFAKLLSEESLEFDYIFIDGSHTFAVDGLTYFLADLVLRPGGYLDFDDYDWTIHTSSLKSNRVMKKLYTRSQQEEKQIKFLVDNFVKKSHYVEVSENKIFEKVVQ